MTKWYQYLGDSTKSIKIKNTRKFTAPQVEKKNLSIYGNIKETVFPSLKSPPFIIINHFKTTHKESYPAITITD